MTATSRRTPGTRLILALGSSLLALGSLSAAHAAEFTQVSADKSQITFVSKQMNVPVDGRFKRVDAQVKFDPAKPETAQAKIEVDLASIDTGNAEADGEVKGKPWFNTAAFPKAVFTAASVKKLADGRFEAHGPLSIKGISRDVVAVFTVRPEGNGAWFDGGFTLKRLPYKIGEGSWSDPSVVADDVQVKFKFYALPGAKK
ncbi:hypothetical protein OTERR_13500 [Oryzomicrobium terrae]|uniref:Lipid/polyisoprenoid-binding YceI-like domain-containing protein n=1 Tax=Oryzomicrobium terrae TaxID=1735038 RepID=A0A5C1E7B6_9RHOO|nr:YceI family protein [Oryzomicrobium terrae]QEL64826.1 hypothetical protein OTERR_13500 [Oryzomicrobium terrae]